MTSGVYIDWDKEELEDLYWNKQLNTIEIAEIKDVKPSTIRKAIKRFGIKKRTISEVHKLMCAKGKKPPRFEGKNHPNWKGGKCIYKARGYIRTRMPEHPRADCNGYVFEHIVVWEKHHGKPVPKDHHVHHINGVRDDNRPENLVVVSKFKHPPFTFRRILQTRIRQLEKEIMDLKRQQSNPIGIL